MYSNEIILKVENLSAGYDEEKVLDCVNLNLLKGEICSVIGEEGSGKSTLLKSITNQIQITGNISFKNVIINKFLTSDMNHIGIDFMNQGGNILSGFTIEEHLDLAFLGKQKEHRRIIWKEIEDTFPLIINIKKQLAGQLSGGERMLLSLSCILASDAQLWILDEPTAGIAPEICIDIKNFLLKMCHKQNKTILLLEHNYEFAIQVSESIVTLKQGKLSDKYFSDVFKKEYFIDEKLYNSNIN